jgi:ABC-type branched-subunit amino acid transport system ATPase component
MSGIRKTFGPVVALDGVDFTVAPRQVHGLLGGNGAGKTTLMNVLYGLYAPDAGTVEIEGRPVVRSVRDHLNQSERLRTQSSITSASIESSGFALRLLRSGRRSWSDVVDGARSSNEVP